MKRPPVPPQAAAPSLAERIELLSAKRQEIIRPILEHPRDYVLLSVRAMAKRLKTDPATVVRIVRGLGFASYRDFQRHLHDLSIAFATSLDTMQSAGKVSSMPAYVRDALEQDLKNLHGLKNSLDAPRLVSLAKRFYDARRIVLLAGDLAAILADYLEYQITLLGLPVFTATSAGRIAHLVRTVNQRDLVLAISFRRGLRQTVEGVHLARARSAYCVGITDTYVSPLARECDEVFLASVESTSFGASYSAPVALVNAILAACGQYRRPQTLAILKEIAEEQRKGFRWYTV
ncbi:MAG TPA: MurR/RpiR family transcriptional regulator [Candidatus Acidoferrum sp.]|jgi:DNA-binding MurR/RpiR family transcriptional regulator|nr:MurR/RpiR family transcriptional regulator [Candidatus Acidoferrum sp.]